MFSASGSHLRLQLPSPPTVIRRPHSVPIAGHEGLSFARLRMPLDQLMAAIGRLGGNLPKVAKCLAIPVVKLSM
jgi:hypothetical protein